MRRLHHPVRFPLLIVALVLLVAAAITAGLVATDRIDLPSRTSPAASPSPSGSPASPPAVLARSAPAVLPSPSATASALAGAQRGRLVGLLDSPSLGGSPGAVVLDGVSGATLYQARDDVARTPASVAKLATAATVLLRMPAGARLTTTVVRGASAHDLVVVGAGDPTLTSQTASSSGERPASMAELAKATAAALGDAGRRTTYRVRVDDSLFTGPSQSPDWPSSYVAGGVVSPVRALSVDEGRVSPGSTARSTDPALAAGKVFASQIARQGIRISGGVSRTHAPSGATALASVESPTIAQIVERCLQDSDNDIAEALLRLSSVASGGPGSFSDGIAAVRESLRSLDLPTPGLDLRDGSGLARSSHIAPITLARLLLAAGDPAQPRLRPVLLGLPVAHFDGTLAGRFGSGASEAGEGVVRAKTGTLTGVSTLAGRTTIGDGSLIFVVMADGVGSTVAARAQLDRVAAGLSR